MLNDMLAPLKVYGDPLHAAALHEAAKLPVPLVVQLGPRISPGVTCDLSLMLIYMTKHLLILYRSETQAALVAAADDFENSFLEQVLDRKISPHDGVEALGPLAVEQVPELALHNHSRWCVVREHIGSLNALGQFGWLLGRHLAILLAVH